MSKRWTYLVGLVPFGLLYGVVKEYSGGGPPMLGGSVLYSLVRNRVASRWGR